MFRTLVVAAALTTAALPAAAQTAAPTPPDAQTLLALGRQYTLWFYTAEADSLFAHMTEEFQTEIHGVDGVREECARFVMRAGGEVELIEDKMTLRQGYPQYWREARFDGFTDEPLVVRWVFDSSGKIAGVGLGPKSRAPAPDAPDRALVLVCRRQRHQPGPGRQARLQLHDPHGGDEVEPALARRRRGS